MKKYDNFKKSLVNLKSIFDYNAPYGIVELTGLVGLCELSFEQAWKVMKEILEQHGYSQAVTGSPKQILKIAFSCGMIKDEGLWLDALVARNNVAHSYNIDVAIDIVNQTKERYYYMLLKLDEELVKNWL